MIEKNQFIDDLQEVYAYMREPLFCAFAGGDPDASDEVQNARSKDRERLVKLLVLALRLYRPEPVKDGTMFIIYRRSRGLNTRDPRLFGRNAYNLQPTTVLSSDDIQQIGLVFEALDTFQSFRQSGPLSLAIELFQSSYAASAMEPRDRLLLLLGALEALTEGKQQPLELPFGEPALQGFLETYRRKRNEVAHGGDASDPDVAALRQIIRYLLCEGITVELLFPRSNRSSGAPLLEGMRRQNIFGFARLAEARTKYQKGIH